MADVKTHLRELSVAFGIKYLLGERQLSLGKFTPQEFFNQCQKAISNDISHAKNIATSPSFSQEQLEIIKNGVRLADLILRKFGFKSDCDINWVGLNTQKEVPVDIIINGISFSLKEESFILENMGLYKYINLMTNSNFGRGLHVFRQFAPKEYNNWFNVTWNLLLSSSKNSTNRLWFSGKYQSEILLVGDEVILTRNGDRSVLPLNKRLDVDSFDKLTSSVTREYVFSKWINDCVQNNPYYLEVKKHCAETAGKNLVEYVKKNLDYTNLKRFLQIYQQEYYYGKTTNVKLKLFKVPNSSEFQDVFEVKDIYYSVPKSQLNTYTIIANKQTGREIVFRNENRFSHGQFNGTPEAKMYYDGGSDLSVIYSDI